MLVLHPLASIPNQLWRQIASPQDVHVMDVQSALAVLIGVVRAAGALNHRHCVEGEGRLGTTTALSLISIPRPSPTEVHRLFRQPLPRRCCPAVLDLQNLVSFEFGPTVGFEKLCVVTSRRLTGSDNCICTILGFKSLAWGFLHPSMTTSAASASGAQTVRIRISVLFSFDGTSSGGGALFWRR